MEKIIIIADESFESRQTMKNWLEREGFKIVEAENGDVALDYALEFEPSLIIAEVDMPVMDGWALCDNTKEYPELKNIPIILMSDFKNINDQVRAVALGAADYIGKPLQMEEVIARVYLTIQKAEETKIKNTQRIQKQACLQGNIETMPICDLVQNFSTLGKSGVLTITGLDDNEGYIFFEDGDVISAKTKQIKGKKAFVRILSWTEGVFQFEEKIPSCNKNIYGNTMSLLIDAMRLVDELEKEKQYLPDLHQMLTIRFSKDFFKWGLVNSHPSQIKILSLISKHQTIQGVMNHTEMEDIHVAKEIANLIEKKFVTI